MYSKSDQKISQKTVPQRGMQLYDKRQLSLKDEYENIVEYLKKKISLLSQYQSQQTIDEIMNYVFEITSPLLKHIEFPMQIPYQRTFCGKRILQTIEFWILYQIIFYLLNQSRNFYFNRLEEQFQIRLNKCLTKEQIQNTHQIIQQIEQVQLFSLNFEKLCSITKETQNSPQINIEQTQITQIEKANFKRFKIIIIKNNNQSIKEEEFNDQDFVQTNQENFITEGINNNSISNDDPNIRNQNELNLQSIQEEQQIESLKQGLQELIGESINETINNNNELVETDIKKHETIKNKTSQFNSLEILYLSSNVEFLVLIHNVNRNNSNSLIQILEGEYEGQFALYQFKEIKDEKIKQEDLNYYQNYLEYRKVCQNRPLVVLHQIQINNNKI